MTLLYKLINDYYYIILLINYKKKHLRISITTENIFMHKECCLMIIKYLNVSYNHYGFFEYLMKKSQHFLIDKEF